MLLNVVFGLRFKIHLHSCPIFIFGITPFHFSYFQLALQLTKILLI